MTYCWGRSEGEGGTEVTKAVSPRNWQQSTIKAAIWRREGRKREKESNNESFRRKTQMTLWNLVVLLSWQFQRKRRISFHSMTIRSNHGTVRELMPSGFTLGTSKLLHSGNSLRKPSSRLFLCQEIYMDILFHSCSLLGREELFEKLNKWRIMIRSNCASKTWAKFFL